ARTAGARVMSSLWSPSRGPTSQIVARGSTSGPVYFQALLPDPGAFALHVANAGLWAESRAVALTDLERHVRRVDEDAVVGVRRLVARAVRDRRPGLEDQDRAIERGVVHP